MRWRGRLRSVGCMGISSGGGRVCPVLSYEYSGKMLELITGSCLISVG
jgi:hypothetical protein